MRTRNWMVSAQFLVAILLLPVMIELFGGTAQILAGDVVIVHPWLFTVFAYLPLLIVIIVYLNASLESWSHYGLLWSKRLCYASVGIGLASAIVLYVSDTLTGSFSAFGISSDPSFIVALGWMFSLGVLVPFTEELLFRGVIQNAFRKLRGWKVHPSILIASGFEVLFHLITALYFTDAPWNTFIDTVPQLLYVLVFGAVGGWVFHKTKSLTGPFLIHAIGNVGELLIFWLLV